MNKQIVKTLPILCLILYVLLIIVSGVMMEYDTELSRKASLGVLVSGEMVSLISSFGLAVWFLSMYKMNKTINIKDSNTAMYLFVAMSLIFFKDANMVIGAVSRFNGPEVSLPYIAAVNGVGLSGLLIGFYFFPSLMKVVITRRNKNSNKLNVSLLPLLFLTLLLSGNFGIILVVIAIVIIVLILILTALWAYYN